jgi:hypothetical protein
MSAERLRGRPVCPDTVIHWTELLREARMTRNGLVEAERLTMDRLIVRLATLLSERGR